MKKIRKERIALLVVIVIQLVWMIYWGAQKSGYYVDEFFTFEKAHYISSSTPKRIKLYDADFLTYDEWHEVSDLKSTLTVTREESLLSDPVSYNIRIWFTKYPYMALLNYVQAVFFEERLSKWSAISINIFFFLLNQILLYQLTVGISGNKTAAVLAVALYGFSGMAASMTVYVRFYMLTTFWMTLCTYLHALMWRENHILKNLVMEFLSVAVLYLAYKDSPLAAVQGVGLICAFLVGLIIRKRYRQAAIYGIPIVGGGLAYVLIKTDYIGYVLHPEKFADTEATNVATASLLGNFLEMTPGAAMDRSIGLIRVICRYLFGGVLIAGIYLLLIIGLMIWYLWKQHSKGVKRERWDWSFFCLALCPCAFYCVVSVCLGLESIRYNSSIFPEFAVCVSLLAMFLTGKTDKRRLVTAAMGCIVLGQAVLTVSMDRVENIYREDRETVEQIQTYHGVDSMVVDHQFDDKVMYECLAYAGEDTKVMFTSEESIDYDVWNNDVLLWMRTSEGKGIIEGLAGIGDYSIVEVGSTHESDVYFVSKHVQ